jgi:nucleotide-binding universal stress UspA family protein
MGLYKHILVPTDFSASSQRALDTAVELALAFGAKLTITHAVEVPGYAYIGMMAPPIDYLTPLREAGDSLLQKTAASVRDRVPGVTALLRSGPPWQQTLEVAKEVGADLIVMGTHGRHGLALAFMGSVAEKVVRMSPIPVLTLRAEDK